MEKLVTAYGLTFEDYTEKDEDGNWSYICKHHAMNVPYGSLDEAGESDCLCGVLDCQHTSDFYVDFDGKGVDTVSNYYCEECQETKNNHEVNGHDYNKEN